MVDRLQEFFAFSRLMWDDLMKHQSPTIVTICATFVLMWMLRSFLGGTPKGGVARAAAPFVSAEECKMVLVVRTDLGMQKGKIAAQCGHATLGAYKKAVNSESPYLDAWESRGQAKVALKVDSREEMYQLREKADQRQVTNAVIRDAGRTQIAAGSETVLAVGPAPKSIIDEITGHLKLL